MVSTIVFQLVLSIPINFIVVPGAITIEAFATPLFIVPEVLGYNFMFAEVPLIIVYKTPAVDVGSFTP
jgi:hypothetical protein